jgi:hypothetical protein
MYAEILISPDSDFHILKVLITPLSSKDEEVVSIACYDIGEFVRFYPSGRAIVKRLARSQSTDASNPFSKKKRDKGFQHHSTCPSFSSFSSSKKRKMITTSTDTTTHHDGL